MQDKKPMIFPEGINFNPPRKGVTETLRGVLTFKVKDAVAFLQKHQNEQGWVNINMLKSKTKDVIYLALSTPTEWKKPESMLKPEEVTAIQNARNREIEARKVAEERADKEFIEKW